MASPHAIAVQALVFAVGFPVIHALRRYAQIVGQVLVVVAVVLGALALLAATGVNAEHAGAVDPFDLPITAEP